MAFALINVSHRRRLGAGLLLVSAVAMGVLLWWGQPPASIEAVHTEYDPHGTGFTTGIIQFHLAAIPVVTVLVTGLAGLALCLSSGRRKPPKLS